MYNIGCFDHALEVYVAGDEHELVEEELFEFAGLVRGLTLALAPPDAAVIAELTGIDKSQLLGHEIILTLHPDGRTRRVRKVCRTRSAHCACNRQVDGLCADDRGFERFDDRGLGGRLNRLGRDCEKSDISIESRVKDSARSNNCRAVSPSFLSTAVPFVIPRNGCSRGEIRALDDIARGGGSSLAVRGEAPRLASKGEPGGERK